MMRAYELTQRIPANGAARQKMAKRRLTVNLGPGFPFSDGADISAAPILSVTCAGVDEIWQVTGA
ncbi:hypothetical protein GCM10017752_22470 [Streptomyces roseoviridis]